MIIKAVTGSAAISSAGCDENIHQQYYGSGNKTLNQMGVLLSDFGTIPFAHTAKEIELANDLGIFVASHTGAAEKSILLKGLHELKHNNLLKPAISTFTVLRWITASGKS